MSFLIVKFLADEAIDYVPSTWATGRSCVFWPPRNAVRLRKELAMPDLSYWETHEVKTYATAGTF